ncbi:MAG: SCO family protein [Oligoflexia bacterium]|nr:SCO family protein [Oligoflexia bacterium]
MVRLSYLIVLLLLVWAGSVAAVEKPEEVVPELALTTQLGAKVDLELPFTDSDGTAVKLREVLLNGRPTVIVPVYYQCPRLCGYTLSGVVSLLNTIELTLGKEYNVVTVSFDATEGPALAAKRRDQYISRLTKTDAVAGAWHFLVGGGASVDALMQQIGFHFRKDNGEFAHTAALILLTPQGEISQYFTGIDFSAWDVRLALIEASKGAIGSTLDHVYLFCFRFDPLKGKYTWAAYAMLKAGGALTILLLGGLIFTLLRRERALQRVS